MLSRFMQEVTGVLDEQIAERNHTINKHYWQKSAYVELEKELQIVRKEALVEEDGAIRWLSSGNYLPDDLCEKLEWVGYTFSREATAEKRELQVAEELAEYRRRQHKMSAEDIAEARAAFGSGVVIVDVISGEEYSL